MSNLYLLRLKIDQIIEKKKLDPFKVRGEMSLRVGFIVGLIDENTPPDPDKIRALKEAASAILNEKIE